MPRLLSLLVVGLPVFLFQVGGKVHAGMVGTYIRDSDTSQRITAVWGYAPKSTAQSLIAISCQLIGGVGSPSFCHGIRSGTPD